nr:uroporphyrinogen decarboxylase family protein [uncultured Sphaerochaeta sp.]
MISFDKRELLEATVQGESTGRIGCGFWHHFSPHKNKGIASVQAHIEFFNAIDADILKVMNEYMYHIDKNIDSPNDWKKLEAIPFSRTPYLAYIEEIKEIKKKLPSDVPVFATVHGVLVSAYHATELPGYFSNPENMVSRHLREDPESVIIGLQSITDTLIEFCRHLAKIGVDGIYYAALGGEAYRFTTDIFSNFVKPFDEQVINAINSLGCLSVLHICKDQVMLPLYQDIKADVVNWAIHESEYDLREGRKLFPDATLLGGFDDRSGVLVSGTISQIERELDEIVANAGRKKLLIGADCTLPEDIALWRLCAAKNYAQIV